jgi:hypothetical protein
VFEPTGICKRLLIAGLALALSPCSSAQMKDFGNRREGTTMHVDALEDLAIVAVHRDFEPFPRNANLSVRFFLPALPGSPAPDVAVEGIELQDSFHYLMESKQPPVKAGTWNVFGQWPTSDVIDKLGIEPANLGVLAELKVGSKLPVYLPVDVYPSDRQPRKHAYTFYFMTGQDLQSLDISVTNRTGQQVNLAKPNLICNRSFNPNCKLYAAGSTQAFDLDMSSLPEGEYHIHLTGHVPGSANPTSLQIALYHHP